MPETGNAEQIAQWNAPGSRPWYEMHAPVDALFEGATEAALDAAGVRAGEQVLDIGCATGTTVIKLAGRVGPTGHVTGVDVSTRSVERGRERLAEAGMTNAEIVLADASGHVYPPSGFSLVFSRFGVMFFTDPVAAFAHIRAAMQPGGRLQLMVFRRAEENDWITGPGGAVASLLPPRPAPEPDAPGQFAWADAGRVRAILEGAGFEAVRLTPHDRLFRLAGPGRLEDAVDFFMHFGPVARAAGEISEADRARVRVALESYLAGQEGPDGVAMQAALWFVSARNPG